MSKIDAYNIGKDGVNLVKSPLHRLDGDLLKGQNCEYRRNEAIGGLGKRGGLSALTGSAMGGTVHGIVPVPLPDPAAITRTLYSAQQSPATDTWRTTTDGTTWAGRTTPDRAAAIAKFDPQLVGFSTQVAHQRLAMHPSGAFYFPIDGYTQYPTASHQRPPLRRWDGTEQADVVAIPYNPQAGGTTNAYVILDQLYYDGWIYISVYDPGGTLLNIAGRVLRLDPATGEMQQLGERFGDDTGELAGGLPLSLAFSQGRLWTGTYSIAGGSVGKVYAIRPGVDTQWTLDFTSPASDGYVAGLADYKGELFASFQADGGTAAKVRKRNTFGTWSTSDTSPGPTLNPSRYFGLIVFNDELYAPLFYDDAGTNTLLVRKFDGTTWTTDATVSATWGFRYPGNWLVFKSVLYLPLKDSGGGSGDGYVIRKSGGTWSQVDNLQRHRGYLAELVTVS